MPTYKIKNTVSKHTWDGDGTSILRLSLDCPLTGECRPFHFLEHSPLLVSVLTVAARCVEKGDNKVQALEAEDTSRSTAARNTTILGRKIKIKYAL